MADMEFNLLHESWIRVMRENCRVEEVSLADALLHAHEYRGLAGELPTQDAAILRLLLAVLHAVFERVDVDGTEAEIETEDDALDRWEALWENGRFPEAPLTAYFAEQEENFWLFHPTRPFWQIPDIPDCANRPQTEPIQKLNGAVSESGNKTRLFSERSGNEKEVLTNAEAARWLVCMNQYDDNTLKTGLGVALLGQFVAIMAKGGSLFETLMLNYVLLNQHGEPWEEIGLASWEQTIKFNENVRTVAYPNDPVAILSYHSRYGKLLRIEGRLKGYKSPKGGICYEEISKNEQMAIWKRDRKKDETYLLKSLNGRQAWRDLDSIIVGLEGRSVLVQWHSKLIRSECLRRDWVLRYEFVSIAYDKSQHSSVDNIISDSLSLHLNLLSDLGEYYRQSVIDEIARCDKVATHIGILAGELFLASGGDTKKKGNPSNTAREQYFYAIDVPFRKWLASLDAADDHDVREQRIRAWRQEAETVARDLAAKMVRDAGTPAFIGKMVAEEKERKKYYSSSRAMQHFMYNMKMLDK